MPSKSPHVVRLTKLALGALEPPPGRRRILTSLVFGVLVHTLFAAAVLSMVTAMYFGMSRGLGAVDWPLAYAVNAALLLQFPVVHSILLTRRGGAWLSALVPGKFGETLGTTTYAIIASLQLLALFALWTPSGTVWWRAEGSAYAFLMVAYATAWMLLLKATYDAGIEVQSGALGWLSMLQNVAPRFPDMPTGGLFRFIRQPIYVAFVLTLWSVPTWTPDQLAIAIVLTAYCLAAPIMKERRFAQRYGPRFEAYKARVPYAVPKLTKEVDHAHRSAKQPRNL